MVVVLAATVDDVGDHVAAASVTGTPVVGVPATVVAGLLTTVVGRVGLLQRALDVADAVVVRRGRC